MAENSPTDSQIMDATTAIGAFGRSKGGGFDTTDRNNISAAMTLTYGLHKPDTVAPSPSPVPEGTSRSRRRELEMKRRMQELRAKEAVETTAKQTVEDRTWGVVLDNSWLTNQIMIPGDELENRFKLQAYKSTAHFKFQDTTIGGHRACNAPPQFTRYCDIRANDLFAPWDPTLNEAGNQIVMSPSGNATTLRSKINFETTTAHTGMGRFYAQALDDGAQELYLQFGIAEFNGLASFFLSAVTYEDAYIAKHGTIPEVYQAVNGIVKFLTCIAMPGTFIMSFLLKTTVGVFLGNKAYKYYYMKPAMHIYWSTVNQIANEIATAMGILVPFFMNKEDENTGKKVQSLSGEELAKNVSSATVSKDKKSLTQGRSMKFSSEIIDAINKQFGDGTTIFSSTTNYIDVYELSTRYQNRVNTFMKTGIDKFVNKSGLANITGASFHELMYQLQGQKYSIFAQFEPFFYTKDIKAAEQLAAKNEANLKDLDPRKQKSGFDAHMKEVLTGGSYEPGQGEGKGYDYIKGPNTGDGRGGGIPGKSSGGKFITSLTNGANAVGEAFENFWSRRAKVFDAANRLANTQVIFLVQPTGATSESFSNSVGEIQSGGIIKSFGKAAHDMRFNFAGGKTGISFIDKGIDAALQMGNSIIDNVTFGFSDLVRGLMLGSYVDVPKIWEDSSGSFPSITYSMDLVAPYGNTYSRFQNIVVPLSCLLAGALPLKTGKASYGSPFLCQAYCQGVQHIRLGIITDLSITRNNGNTQQTIDKQTNFVSVSFTITDLGSRIAAPINNSLFNPNGWFPMLEEDTPFSDYVTALSGKHVSDIKWIWPSIGHNLSTAFKQLSGELSPTAITGAIGNFIGSTPVTGWLFAYPSVEANHNAL